LSTRWSTAGSLHTLKRTTPSLVGNLLGRIGGDATIAALIDGLYDRIETDPVLRPLFNRDLTNEREAQQRFFVEWLGGDTAHSDRAHLPLAHRLRSAADHARAGREVARALL